MKVRTLVALACVGCFLLVGAAQAQTPTTGQIAGQVLDPTGAAIPGAHIVLTSEAGAQREATSDATGRYRFPLLPPGVYHLEVSTSGFNPMTVERVVVRITETTTVDVALTLAAREESLVVTAAPPLVDTESPTRGEVIQQDILRQLPLPTRNFQQLLTLTPGTSGSLPNSAELGRGDAVFNVNGQRSISNSMIINGVDANSIGTGSTPNLAVPTTDSLQEFIVQTSLYDASQGRASGGIVAAVTKSGTNDYHGNLYYFIRNKNLNANNFFLNRQGTPKPSYDRSQFGGTFGGPFKKDKAWFFLSYQGTRENNGTSLLNSLATVFVPENLTDDRSYSILDPTSGLFQLSASYGLGGFVDPTAVALLQATLPDGSFLIPSAPSPTTPAGLPNNVAVTIPTLSSFDEDQFNANLDFQLSAANRLSGKLFYADNDVFQGKYNSFGTGNPLQLPGFGANTNFKQWVVSVNDTHVFNPSLLNDFRFGFSAIPTISAPDQPFTAAQFGISSPLSSLFPEMPTISISNMMDIGPSPFEDNDAQVDTYTLGDTLTWTKGRHTLKFGGEYKRQVVDLRFDLYTRGEIFNLGLLFGNPFADFLFGSSSLSIMGSGVNKRGNRANDFNWFVNDDWRINDQLTLTLGLRYDYYGPFYEVNGRYVAIDPQQLTTVPIPPFGVAVTGGFVQADNATSPLPGIPTVRKSLVPPDKNNFAPRLGFAWRPMAQNDRFVVRGGYGIYYDRPNARLLNNQVLNFPYDTLALVFLTPMANPFVQVPLPSAFPLDFSDATLFPFGGPPAFLPAASLLGPVAAVPANGIFPDIHNFRSPYVQQYNAGIQYEFARDWLLDLGYVGSSGRKLLRLRNFNQGATAGDVFSLTFSGGPYATGLSDLPVQAFGVHLMQSSANSSYNSLQAQLTKRYSNGLQFLLSYTYSHSLDDYSGDPSGTSDNSVVPGDEVRLDNRASSGFDRRHRLVFSYIYDLPKAYHGDSKAAALAVNDWQLAGILTFQSGTPFSVLTNATAFIQARADFISGCSADSASLSGDVTSRLDGYFDTSCFTSAVGGFGNTGRNILRGPDQRNFDFSIIKFFPVDETKKFEFRAEFFNITNTPSFANPVTIVQSGNFGQIVSTSTSARIIQFALKFNF